MEPNPSVPRNGDAATAAVAGPSQPKVEAVAGAGAESADPLFDLPFVAMSDQACKECRRRKAKCDKVLPMCNVCSKYRRHCLYEKNARTPLTRRHLTEVEARLERAEAIIKYLRGLVPPHLRSWEKPGLTAAAATQQAAEGNFNFSSTVSKGGRDPGVSASPESGASTATQSPHVAADASQTQGHAESEHPEEPPVDDFEWCEMEEAQAHGMSLDGMAGGTEEELPISDGMASLSVNERKGGYLGVASGAALLRLIEPKSKKRASARQQPQHTPSMFPLTSQPNPNRHVADYMVDSYFRLYHVSYPILHEPTFRAQYNETLPRPNGPCWSVLAYIVAAIGVWSSSSTTPSDTLDLALFSQARSMLTFDYLELGNLTLVQALGLSSNYLQKRDKPNSGYNYLGLAVRMAMGIGLHKEFQGWNISPLSMEIRRRIWWSLCVFDVGATVTFSRPDVWPYKGVEVSFPLNVDDKDLTSNSTDYPQERDGMTPYTAVATQARFHIATRECYDSVISKPFPSAATLLQMDARFIQPWQDSIPPFFAERTKVAAPYVLAQLIMAWRMRNLRIILYRAFVIRRALGRSADNDAATNKAYDRCLADAKETIEGIADFWARHEHNRFAAWYALYFVFQAALIPCICLRHDPNAPEAAEWRQQIDTTLRVIRAMAPVNASAARSYRIISDLCGGDLDTYEQDDAHHHPQHHHQSHQPSEPEQLPPGTAPAASAATAAAAASLMGNHPDMVSSDAWLDGTHHSHHHNHHNHHTLGEIPQDQINSVFSMMWPNLPPMEAADVVMGDDADWVEFLRAGSVDGWPSIDQ